MEDFKRQIAKKVSIQDLQNGVYVRQEGWQPNFVQTQNGEKVSRINILGTVVSEQQENQFVIDDGTGKMSIRAFDSPQSLPTLHMGQVIMVIGRPREFGSEMYILPEIVKSIEDKKWIQVRLKELRRSPQPLQEETEPVQDKSPLQQIYEAIKNLDKGDGANVEDILQIVHHENAEGVIQKLLREGEIFEIAPGKLKNA